MIVALELPAELIEEVAHRAAELVAHRQEAQATEPWLTVEGAAQHLALSVSQVYSLCSARRTNGFPVHKEGSRSYFKVSELDAWRASR